VRLPGINVELAAAVRRVGAAYNRLAEAERPDINAQEWRDLEAAIDRHCARGDRDSALAAVEHWEAAAMRQLGGSGS
jgi:hypothetical protein